MRLSTAVSGSVLEIAKSFDLILRTSLNLLIVYKTNEDENKTFQTINKGGLLSFVNDFN